MDCLKDEIGHLRAGHDLLGSQLQISAAGLSLSPAYVAGIAPHARGGSRLPSAVSTSSAYSALS